MFYVTEDELKAGCTKKRYDPELSAKGFDPLAKYEARVLRTERLGEGKPTPKDIVRAMEEIFDPEIPVNIYELGLIYDINVSDDGDVMVLMTLTAPNCPAAEILPAEVAEGAAAVAGVRCVGVELTFEVPWNPDMMSEIAELALGIY